MKKENDTDVEEKISGEVSRKMEEFKEEIKESVLEELKNSESLEKIIDSSKKLESLDERVERIQDRRVSMDQLDSYVKNILNKDFVSEDRLKEFKDGFLSKSKFEEEKKEIEREIGGKVGSGIFDRVT